MLVTARRKTMPQLRGFGISYREGEINHCPGCGRTHWYIGRLSAECAFCGTALPLLGASISGSAAIRQIGKPKP